MLELLRRLSNRSLVRYIIVGGVSYLIEVSVIIFLIRVLSFSSELAVACSFWVGLSVSFVLQKYVVFKSTDKDKKAVGKQIFAYALLVLINYVFTVVTVGLLSPRFGVIEVRTAALITTTLWNYYIYKHIFAVRDEESTIVT